MENLSCNKDFVLGYILLFAIFQLILFLILIIIKKRKSGSDLIMKKTICLIIMGIILIIFGIAVPVLPIINADLTYITGVFWKDSSMSESAESFYKYMFGEYSSVFIPFGFIILMISVFGYKQGEKWIWNSLFIGILIWFVIDQGFSIAFGAYMNAINNCILFILLITPVIFSRKYFYN